MSAETKDRITCHVLDTATGQPARGVRVKLELVSSTPPPALSSNGTASGTISPPPSTTTATASSSSFSALPTTTTQLPGTTLPAAAAVGGPKIFESLTDDDGRIKVWLPYSSATSSGEVPVYTLEDVLGSLPPGGSTSQWTLRFDSAGYFGGADKTFYPEVAVTFTVREGERYHVPLLLAPFGYSTYRGS